MRGDVLPSTVLRNRDVLTPCASRSPSKSAGAASTGSVGEPFAAEMRDMDEAGRGDVGAGQKMEYSVAQPVVDRCD
jgi:hypothetical protein